MTDMTPAECKAALEENLGKSMTSVLDLQEILSEERQALRCNDTMSLNDGAARKRMCVVRLDELDAERTELSKACGFGDTPNAVPQLAGWCDDGESVLKTWTAFLDVARQCSDMNTTNGAIIRVRQSQVQSAICLLRSGTEDGNTYGPTGQNSKELGTRSLAQA